jgi:hypothetical protein
MRTVAIPDYRSTPGNKGAYALRRVEADTKSVVAVGAQGVVVKPLSDASLCFETCVIIRTDNSSRLANEFARAFLRRYEPQRCLPPKQLELSLSA